MEFTEREIERASAYMLAYALKAKRLGLKQRLSVYFEGYVAHVKVPDEDLLADEDLSRFRFDPMDGYSMEDVHRELNRYLLDMKIKHESNDNNDYGL